MVLEEVDDWVEAEIFWIAYFRTLGCDLLNRSDGGDGAKGHKPSLATRRRLSVALKGKKKPTPAEIERIASLNRGKKLSESTKSKIRTARARQIITEEARQKISASLRGKLKPPRTAAHSAAISMAKKGKPGRRWTDEQRMALSVKKLSMAAAKKSVGFDGHRRPE
jgi:hypothetical protein